MGESEYRNLGAGQASSGMEGASRTAAVGACGWC
jgi:hypothetical protein